MMRGRLYAAVIVAMTSIGVPVAALADAATYPNEVSCAAPSVTSSFYSGVHENMAQTPRGPLAYYRIGHGTPVVLVTGFQATLTEWNATFLKELARHHEVIIFDNRGVGRSMPDAASFTLTDMARDTAALIETLKLHRPTVVGWSMGGSIVQRLAIDTPSDVARIVLMGALAPGQAGEAVPEGVMAKLSGASGASFHDIMAMLFTRSSVDTAAHCFRQDMFRPADYRFAEIPLAVTDGQAALLEAWSGDDAAAESLHGVHRPVLILVGTDDAIVPVRNAEVLRRLLPNSRLLTVKGGGHAMMYQYPVALAREIGTFAGR